MTTHPAKNVYPRLLLFMCALLLIAVVRPVEAQARTLGLYSLVEDTLAPGESHDWLLIAPAGAVVSFVVRAQGGAFDPVLELREGGSLLYSNDDYDYPNTRDAALEAITLPRAGTYTVRVGALPGAGGAYSLAALPGYAFNALRDEFDSASGWGPLGGDANVTIESGRLRLAQSGVRRGGSAVNADTAPFGDFYAVAEIASVRGRGGWTVGLLARQVAGSAYRLDINDRGQWRFVLQTDDGDSILRDWSVHPAIVAGDDAFSLGILANQDDFDLFYDSQFIGSVRDSTLVQAGRIGLAARTGAAVDSSITVEFESLTVTTRFEPKIFPQQIGVTDGAAMALELERRGLLRPSTMALTISESFVESANAGVGELRLGRGARYTTFALGAMVSWQAGYADAPVGCGLLFGLTGDTDYSLAFVNQAGDYGVSQRSGGQFLPGLYGSLGPLGNGPHHLLVIAGRDLLHFYLNGFHRGSLPFTPVEGEVGVAAVNYEPVNISCRFANLWLAAG